MIVAVQKVCKQIGLTGCYFLCILRIAEKILDEFLDPFHFYLLARQGRFMKETCFMDIPAGLLGAIVGGEWIVLKAGDGLDSAGNAYDLPLAYELQPGEFEIDRLEIEGEKDSSHFVLSDFDPYGDSRTRRLGHKVSMRIFRRTA